MERFPSQGYLHTPIPSDGFWLVYEMLDRKINKASAFSPPCSHTTPSRPGHPPRQQPFLPGRAPAAARRCSRSAPGAGLGPPHAARLPPASGSGASAAPDAA